MFSGCSQDGLRRSQIYRFSDVLACGSGGSGVSSGSDEPSMFAGSGGSCRSVDLMGLVCVVGLVGLMSLIGLVGLVGLVSTKDLA